MYLVRFTRRAAKDVAKLKGAGLADKAKALIEIVRENPFQTPPTYEALVGNLDGLYSRRINLKHRFVYEVVSDPVTEDGIRYDGTVKVVRMWTHYDGVR